MSAEGLVIVGLVVVGGLVLVPVVLVARVLLAIIAESRRTHIAEARRVTRTIPGLGTFSTTDNELWFGEVAGLTIRIVSPGEPPTVSHVEHVQSIVRNLRGLTEKSRKYLAAHDDNAALVHDAARFWPYALEIDDASCFVVELEHPADVDGVYRVYFRNGEPVSAERDD